MKYYYWLLQERFWLLSNNKNISHFYYYVWISSLTAHCSMDRVRKKRRLAVSFINDIAKCIKNSKILLYADDLKMYKEITIINDCLKMQNDINRLLIWSKSNLKFNIDKCAVMSITRKILINYAYKINDEQVNRKLKFKNLGILFDSKLLFVEHKLSTCKPAYSVLGL